MKFSHLISVEPRHISKRLLSLNTSGWNHQRADNEVYLIDTTDKSSWVVGAGMVASTLIAAYFMPPEERVHPIGLPVAIFFFLIGFYLILYRIIQKPKELIFNRLTGIITVPRFMWMKSITFPFNEAWASVVWGNVGDNISSQFGCGHISNKRKGGKIGIGNHDHYEAQWSLYVWYMDKNRPLPPGEAFDEYRNIDFERRKAEGFPPPLYKSRIPTPEATTKQQTEREKYWKDKAFMVV